MPISHSLQELYHDGLSPVCSWQQLPLAFHDEDNKVTCLDILNPSERFLKCLVNRATQNSGIDGMLAIQYRGRAAPVTPPASVAGGELHHWPVAGTA